MNKLLDHIRIDDITKNIFFTGMDLEGFGPVVRNHLDDDMRTPIVVEWTMHLDMLDPYLPDNTSACRTAAVPLRDSTSNKMFMDPRSNLYKTFDGASMVFRGRQDTLHKPIYLFSHFLDRLQHIML